MSNEMHALTLALFTADSRGSVLMPIHSAVCGWMGAGSVSPEVDDDIR